MTIAISIDDLVRDAWQTAVDIERQRAEKAEAEVQCLREINDVVSAKLDSMIIVNGQALACSAPVAAEVERLQNMLNVDSQMFYIECLKAEVKMLRAALVNIAEATNADDPDSYRCDDREGCLDYVYAKATHVQDVA